MIQLIRSETLRAEVPVDLQGDQAVHVPPQAQRQGEAGGRHVGVVSADGVHKFWCEVLPGVVAALGGLRVWPGRGGQSGEAEACPLGGFRCGTAFGRLVSGHRIAVDQPEALGVGQRPVAQGGGPGQDPAGDVVGRGEPVPLTIYRDLLERRRMIIAGQVDELVQLVAVGGASPETENSEGGVA